MLRIDIRTGIRSLVLLTVLVGMTYSQEMLLELAHDQAPIQERDGISHTPMTPLEQMYTTFQDKKAPLWKCDGWYSGIKWRLPRDIDCKIPEKNRTSKEVQITLYWTDISKQTVDGYECYAIRQGKWAYTNFFNQISSRDNWETYLRVTEKDCWNMVNLKVAPDLSSMAYEKNGIFGTYKPLVLETSWFSNESAEVTNYFVIPLTVAVLELDESVKVTASLQRPCFYNESSCETEIGILVWKSSEVKECRLKEGETSSCIYTIGDEMKTLTCPDLQLSLHDLSVIEMCGVKFGTSSQNVYFSQSRTGDIDMLTVTPDQVRNLISSPKKKNKRKRRSTNAFDNLDSFVNARSNFITDTLVNHTETYVRELEAQICHINQRNLHLIKYMAQSGHPTLIPLFFLGEEQYRATFCGDGLSIWKCSAVHSYKFLVRTQCTREWPVSYIYEGMQLEGWVSPMSHNIVDQPTELQEPCDEYYFDTGEHLLQLTAFGPKTASLPTLPVLGEKIDHSHAKVPLSFKGTTGLNIGRYTDAGHSYTIWQQFAKRQKHFKELKQDVKDLKRELTVGRVLFESIAYVYKALPKFVKYCLGFGVMFGLCYGLVALCIKFSVSSSVLSWFNIGFPLSKFFTSQGHGASPHVENTKPDINKHSVEYEQQRAYAPCAPLMPNILSMAGSVPPPPPRATKRKSK